MLLMVPLSNLSIVGAADFSVWEGEGKSEDLESGIELFGSHSVTSDYGVGTSNINLFGPLAAKLPFGTHYVYWRDGQYQYRLAYSQEITVSGSRFSSPSVTLVTYQTNMGYGSQATWTVSKDSNFSLSAGNYLVWSDLGDYPQLVDRSVRDYVHAAVIGLAVLFVFNLLRSLARSIRS